jgi:hypothetical protein
MTMTGRKIFQKGTLEVWFWGWTAWAWGGYRSEITWLREIGPITMLWYRGPPFRRPAGP